MAEDSSDSICANPDDEPKSENKILNKLSRVKNVHMSIYKLVIATISLVPLPRDSYGKNLVIVIGLVILTILYFPVGSPVTLSKQQEVSNYIARTYCRVDQYVCKNTSKMIEDAVKAKKKLPVINLKYLKFLNLHACELPKKYPLVIFGPPQSEKRVGLLQIAKFWCNQKRMVVHVNLSDFNGNIDQFGNLVRKAVTFALSKRGISNMILVALHKGIVSENEEARSHTIKERIFRIVGIFLRLTLAIFNKVVVYFIPVPTESIEKGSEQYAINLQYYMESLFVSQDDVFDKINFKDIFKAIHLLSRIDPSFAPIVLFTGLKDGELLCSEKGDFFINFLADLLYYFESDQNNIPVIFTTTSSLWLVKVGISRFQYYEISHLTLEEMTDLFVYNLNVWTEDEMKLIVDEIGTHPKHIKTIYNINKLEGRSLKSAIAAVQESTCTEITQAIKEYTGSENLTEYLEELPVKVTLMEAIHTEKIWHLLNKRVVHVNLDQVLDLVAYGMRHSIIRCLKSFKNNVNEL